MKNFSSIPIQNIFREIASRSSFNIDKDSVQLRGKYMANFLCIWQTRFSLCKMEIHIPPSVNFSDKNTMKLTLFWSTKSWLKRKKIIQLTKIRLKQKWHFSQKPITKTKSKVALMPHPPTHPTLKLEKEGDFGVENIFATSGAPRKQKGVWANLNRYFFKCFTENGLYTMFGMKTTLSIQYYLS